MSFDPVIVIIVLLMVMLVGAELLEYLDAKGITIMRKPKGK